MPYIYGRNPIIEALRTPESVQKIYIQHGNQQGKVKQIYRIAREEKIPVTTADTRKLQQLVGDGNHQGIVALISSIEILTADLYIDQIPMLKQPQLSVVLDKIHDPYNMGAIIRSAEVLGADAVIYSAKENSPVTDTVIKASAGAALHCPLYKTKNLIQTVDELKAKEIWVYGASLEGEVPLWEVDFTRSCSIIIGNEEKGMRPVLQKKCDTLFKIPQMGKTQSLNASVSAGIVLAEIARQRA